MSDLNLMCAFCFDVTVVGHRTKYFRITFQRRRMTRMSGHTVSGGLDWTGLDWTGLDWTGLIKRRLVKRGLVNQSSPRNTVCRMSAPAKMQDKR